ncbi:alpha/beta hydrolase [Schlegelella sp. S2-27]|uniref:Alpha/beta hydrolase n=1 Tax=Caldimonas mangrovi TaxID=2944811 RepID=A0ABT0YPL8_9BURK|nr:alpha/beta hydrolase [Caldimonas mangrovi]MCM5680269.1 alpha/beta hydrolase [Caldimonas mangrovi]
MSTSIPLVFSHANGFPAGTYRLLFERLRAAGYDVRAIEKLGHDPRFPVTSNWPHLRDQLIDFIETEALGGPAYLVGHSLGGFLSLLACLYRPDLVRGVVLLDSPVIHGVKARGVQFFKATGWISRISPGKISRQRRNVWTSADEAHAHFAAKPNFARWHPQVLRDYIAAGTYSSGGQHALSFRREVETEIYDTLPHHFPRLLRSRPLQRPVAFVGGTRSVEVRQVGMRATQQVTQGRISWIEGGHLYPFEQPLETVDAVVGWLRAFETAQGPDSPAAARAETGQPPGKGPSI